MQILGCGQNHFKQKILQVQNEDKLYRCSPMSCLWIIFVFFLNGGTAFPNLFQKEDWISDVFPNIFCIDGTYYTYQLSQ